MKQRPLWFDAIVGIGSFLFVFLFLLPVCNSERHEGSVAILSNIKQCATSLAIYSEDNDGRLPNAYRWMSSTLPYSKKVEIYLDPKNEEARLPLDPKLPVTGLYGIAFFLPMSEVKSLSLPDRENQIMLFTSKQLGWNAAAGLKTINPTTRPKDNRFTAAFADTSARSIVNSPEKLDLNSGVVK